MESSINSLLSKLAIAGRIANERAMVQIGLHAGQAQILSTLAENDGQSQSELVRNLGVSAPTINKMIAKLSEQGFVSNRKCTKDNRVMRVRLTAKGARIQPKLVEQISGLEAAVLKDFSETEKLLLPILLEKVYSNLTQSTVEP